MIEEPEIKPPRAAAATDSLLLMAGAFVLYRLLAQNSVHTSDTLYLLWKVRHGDVNHPWHLLVLYPPVWIHALLARFGWLPLASVRFTMALAAALGIGCLHRAALIHGAPRATAARAALCVAATPAVFYFATIIELQALCLACTGLATWAFARVGARPVAGRALLAGCSSGFAAAVHSTGQLLPLLFVTLGVAGWSRCSSWRRGTALSLAIGASHLLTFLALGWLARDRAHAVESTSVALLQTGLSALSVTGILSTTLHEWLLPFAPFSVAALVIAGRNGCWRQLAGLLACVGGCLLITFLLLGGEPSAIEFGAYLLPLALPMCWLSVQGATPARFRILLTIGVIGSLSALVLHARARPVDAEFAADARRLATTQPMVILAGTDLELDSLGVFAPDLEVVDVRIQVGMQQSATEACRTAEALFERVQSAAAAKGCAVVVPLATWDMLRSVDGGAFRPLVDDFLPRTFRLERVAAGMFTGWAVLPQR